jgi:hypothetical protein
MNELTKVRDRYLDRAAELESKAHGENADQILESAKYYHESAQAVDRLIVLGNCQTVTQ